MDIHSRTASEFFGVPEDQVTPEQRMAAKAVNFHAIYGQRTGNTDISAMVAMYQYFPVRPPVSRGSDRDVLRSLILDLVLRDFV
jgi:DNA polymerase family A